MRLVLDGVYLGKDLVAVKNNEFTSTTTVAAAFFTPKPRCQIPTTASGQSQNNAPELPTATELVCGEEGGAGCFGAPTIILKVVGETDHDWKALECVQANELAQVL